jgi:hypothetical protein
MHKRWYDHHPLLSMAISLLQNATLSTQATAAREVFELMAQQQPQCNELGVCFDKLAFIFTNKRENLHPEARKLIETLKHVSSASQDSLAMCLINIIYLLEQEASADLEKTVEVSPAAHLFFQCDAS